MKDNTSKYFIIVIAVLAVIILLIILVAYFINSNSINSSDLASVNGQILTKTDLISYNCSLTPKGSIGCTSNYIDQLQNLINYTLEKQYLEKHNDLPSKKQVYIAMFSPGVIPPNVSHMKYYSDIYNYYYRSLVINNIENLLVNNATGDMFFIDNYSIYDTKFVLNPSVEKSILSGFREKLLSGKYTVQSLVSSEGSIELPYQYSFSNLDYKRLNMDNYKTQIGNWGSQMTNNIVSFNSNKVSPIYTYVYTVKNKVIATFYYFFENTTRIGSYSNISGVLSFLRSSANITLY